MASDGTRQTLAADGSTTFESFIGLIRLSLTGDFGGGAAKLQNVDPSGATIDVANGSFTTVTDSLFDFPPGAVNTLRVNLSGSSNPDLDVWIQGAQSQ